MDGPVLSANNPASQALVSLHSLGTRCLYERASRRLDGEIYCAIHNLTDRNPLLDDQQLRARENGQVLLEPGEEFDWIEAPPFTSVLKYAESLLPDGLCTLYRDARKVCATALQARALVNEPPPLISNVVQLLKV
jgi:hypothetical protein